MKYRNTKTGVVVDVNSKVQGDWEPLEVPNFSVKEEKTEPTPAPKRKRKKV